MRELLWLAVILIFLTTGCATFQVAGQVQSGRRALLMNDPETALAYLLQAVEKDPNYIYSSGNFRESVWTYVGRAQYALGRYDEARRSFERALSVYKDDAMAQLYLGLVMLRSGEQPQGRKQIQTGMKNIADWIEYLNRTTRYYAFWDPNGEIRKEIERARPLLEAEKMAPDKDIIESAEWVGKQMEEEVDKVRTDQQREFNRDRDFRRGFGVGIGIGF
ncbi:MAG TPA: tetratricopeptide repeat protein [Candidatus Binatia bacterium]